MRAPCIYLYEKASDNLKIFHPEGRDVLDLSLHFVDVGLHAGRAVHHEDDVGSKVLLGHPHEQLLASHE